MSDTPLIYLDGQFASEGVSGRIMRFKAGEGLPVHTHPTARHNHFTVVLSGRLVCHGRPAIAGAIIQAGDVIDWVVGEPHGFTALEAGATILQINKSPL